MHLVPQPEKLEDRKYQIGAGVIAVVITLLVIQMGLTVLSTVPMASIQNRLNASGLIRFIILHTPISSSLFHLSLIHICKTPLKKLDQQGNHSRDRFCNVSKKK